MFTTQFSAIDSAQSKALTCFSGLGSQSDSEAVLFKEVPEQLGVLTYSQYKSIKVVKCTLEKQIGDEFGTIKLEIPKLEVLLCQADYEYYILKFCRY
jgi:hypothetical protein